MLAPVPMRVGIDLVSVASVRESLAVHAERYLARVYTDAELDDCRSDAGIDVERLAGRFAAKEATIKVLRPDDEPLPWRCIEVRRELSGATEIQLTGHAAELADAAGIVSLALSISHEDTLACAVVVAELREG